MGMIVEMTSSHITRSDQIRSDHIRSEPSRVFVETQPALKTWSCLSATKTLLSALLLILLFGSFGILCSERFTLSLTYNNQTQNATNSIHSHLIVLTMRKSRASFASGIVSCNFRKEGWKVWAQTITDAVLVRCQRTDTEKAFLNRDSEI